MTFGKRAAGDLPTTRPAREADAAEPLIATPGGLGVRTRVANPGEMDRSFIALASASSCCRAGGASLPPPCSRCSQA